MNVDGCRGQAWVAQVTSKLVSSRTKILLMNNGRMHWSKTSLQKSILARVTLDRICLKLKSSVGALFGAYYQLLGTDMESLNTMGLYLSQRWFRVLAQETSDIAHTLVWEKGGGSDCNFLCYCTCNSPVWIYKKPGHQPRIYEAPNSMTPPYFSVLQYSTLQTNSKG